MNSSKKVKIFWKLYDVPIEKYKMLKPKSLLSKAGLKVPTFTSEKILKLIIKA